MRLDVEEPDAWTLDSMELDNDLMPWSLILGQRSCAIICLPGHFFRDFCLLGFEEGALGLDMPT
jgi:hypothetical protein